VRLPRSARRSQLLGAAQEVFVAQGYHAAAMDDIAERAGVSKPVLYQHFPGKFELYLALLDQHADAMVGAVREALASTSDNKARVAATIAAYFRLCADAISGVIREDAGLPEAEAELLAVGLVGMAQVAARYWLSTDGSIPRDAAARLLASLSWRGLGAFPRAGEPH
jgi:AcrR family transcriptional regulator